MTAINDNLTGEEGIVWMKANVLSQQGAKFYYIPRFEKVLDVLDMQKTIFVKGTDHIVKPYFSLEKIKNLSVFHKPGESWEIPHTLYINEAIRDTLISNKFTGLSFENIKVI